MAQRGVRGGRGETPNPKQVWLLLLCGIVLSQLGWCWYRDLRFMNHPTPHSELFNVINKLGCDRKQVVCKQKKQQCWVGKCCWTVVFSKFKLYLSAKFCKFECIYHIIPMSHTLYASCWWDFLWPALYKYLKNITRKPEQHFSIKHTNSVLYYTFTPGHKPETPEVMFSNSLNLYLWKREAP